MYRHRLSIHSEYVVLKMKED